MRHVSGFFKEMITKNNLIYTILFIYFKFVAMLMGLKTTMMSQQNVVLMIVLVAIAFLLFFECLLVTLHAIFS